MEHEVTPLDDSLTIPLPSRLKNLIKKLAARDERNPTEFSRLVLKRGIAEAAREAGLEKEAKAAGLELAVA